MKTRNKSIPGTQQPDEHAGVFPSSKTGEIIQLRSSEEGLMLGEPERDAHLRASSSHCGEEASGAAGDHKAERQTTPWPSLISHGRHHGGPGLLVACPQVRVKAG